MSLNRYRDYIDTLTKEGILLYDNAITNVLSPLEPDQKISLTPKNAPWLVETLNKLGNTYRFDYMIKNIPTLESKQEPLQKLRVMKNLKMQKKRLRSRPKVRSIFWKITQQKTLNTVRRTSE